MHEESTETLNIKEPSFMSKEIEDIYAEKLLSLMIEFAEKFEATVCLNCDKRFTDCLKTEQRLYNNAKGEFFAIFLDVLLWKRAYPTWEAWAKNTGQENKLNKASEERFRKMLRKNLEKAIDIVMKEEPFKWKI